MKLFDFRFKGSDIGKPSCPVDPGQYFYTAKEVDIVLDEVSRHRNELQDKLIRAEFELYKSKEQLSRAEAIIDEIESISEAQVRLLMTENLNESL